MNKESRESMNECTKYGLNCTKCGEPFESCVAFPEPQLCSKCQKPMNEKLREQIAGICQTHSTGKNRLVPMSHKDLEVFRERANEILIPFKEILDILEETRDDCHVCKGEKKQIFGSEVLDCLNCNGSGKVGDWHPERLCVRDKLVECFVRCSRCTTQQGS